MVANRSPVRRKLSWWMRAAAVAVAPLLACGTEPGGTDPGGPPTGDPATGPGGGSNLTCGGSSFPPNATFYQDISQADLDPESGAIMAALDRDGWANPPARQNLGIDFSFEI